MSTKIRIVNLSKAFRNPRTGLAGFIQPDEGAILKDDRPIDGPAPDRGMVFQEYGEPSCRSC